MTARAHSVVLTLVAVVSLPLRAQQGEGASAPATTTDWTKEVERACTHPRYGLRLAAARRVAAGGDDAVPAILQFAAAKGATALPVALVECIADSHQGGPRTMTLLRQWADDRAFYWRAQATRGLALRAGPSATADLERFRRGSTDPAWLVRAYSCWGLGRTGQPPATSKAALSDADPRARTRLAALLLGDGDTTGVPELVASLADERTILGDPWGRRRAQEAFTALRAHTGADHGYRQDQDYAANRGAIAAFQRGVAGGAGDPPPRLGDPELAFTGGVAVLSCQRGDLFVRWTADGTVLAGLEAAEPVALPAATWNDLSRAAGGLVVPKESGVVICDSLRVVFADDGRHGVAAPASLPAPLAVWFRELAAALDEAGAAALAADLRDRVAQFAAD